MKTEIIIVDYHDPVHVKDLLMLMETYARDPMGGGKGLDDGVKQCLAGALAKIPHAFSVLGYIDGAAAGLMNGFEAFSTFACKPLVNIHDAIVLEKFRGLGLSHMMLRKVEEIARERGCCKITLEVLEENETARASYRKFGFEDYRLDPMMCRALFWQKELH